MTSKLPYMASPGSVRTVLEKIIEARVPERFTQDFLETKLGAKGGSARPIIPLLKRIGLLQQDGSTTDLYRRFRTDNTRGAAMATALRIGYGELFDRNEYAHELSKPKLLELINSVSGAEKGNRSDELTASTFLNLKEYADFDADEEPNERVEGPIQKIESLEQSTNPSEAYTAKTTENDFNISYTINLNLPETDDIKVFNAIFKALNEHILKK